MKRLAGKVALATAVAGRIDVATARALADDDADVAISYATSDYEAKALVRELRKKGIRSAAFAAEVIAASAYEARPRLV